MSKKTNPKNIVINGAMLTPKTIDQIRDLQANQCEIADNAARTIADAISVIIQCNDQSKGIQNMEELICELSYVRDFFREIGGG